MSEEALGGIDIGSPQEGGAPASEQLSEEAKQRFAAAGAAMQQIRKEEKKSKRKDDQVAQVIIQFLGSKQHAHLFILISRLVARNCPSIFILAVLSLIHEESRTAVQQYLGEHLQKTAEEAVDESMPLTRRDELDAQCNRELIRWIMRMQMVLSTDAERILLTMMIENIDGTILQLATFVVKEFFTSQEKVAPYEKIQPLTAGILQTVFEPFLPSVRKILQERTQSEKTEDDDTAL